MDLGNIILEKDEINAGGLNIPLIKGEKGEKRRHRQSRYSRNTRREAEKRGLVMY
jgi:hypothetical protein